MLQKRWIGAVLAVSFGLGSILNPLLLISGTTGRNELTGVNTTGVNATQSGVTVTPESIPTKIKNHSEGQSGRTVVAKPRETNAVNSTAMNQAWKSGSAGTMNQSGAGTNARAHTVATASNTGTGTGLSNSQFQILARLIKAEAGGEPFLGQVAVGAVLMNRIRSGKFPQTISANVFRNNEFESVSNGYIWNTEPTADSYRAATLALKGWDPTGGALYFFNPAKSSSAWIWSRPVYTVIGSHYFAG